jgi:uncharacterized membrane protein
MKKDILKFSGLALVIIGIFTLIIQPFSSVTGAVIDLSTLVFRTYFAVSLAIIIAGFITFYLGSRK